MSSAQQAANLSGAHLSPPPPSTSTRHRPLTRSATLSDVAGKASRRRGSVFSDFSDTRKGIQNSTEDLFLPRANGTNKFTTDGETSNLHSIPLGLALLPAVGGLLFKDGSAVVTDITLLALAAIFLNWSVRVPWEWYRSAQATKPREAVGSPLFDPIIEEASDSEGHDDTAIASSQELPHPEKPDESKPTVDDKSTAVETAQNELQAHELLALVSCFVFPAIGAWLLHAIRSQLSRPSEGLVSNYNLTVFLLAAEIRPVSHLIKMMQTRTLFLQRIVSSDGSIDDFKMAGGSTYDLNKRIEELEVHAAESAEREEKKVSQEPPDPHLAAQLTSDVRKGMQSELDALNRAVRRYEKRTTISALQTESRIQELESRLQDALVIAAAAQRSVQKQPNNFVLILLNWASAAVVIPVQHFWLAMSLPVRAAGFVLSFTRVPTRKDRSRDGRKGKAASQSRYKEKLVRSN